MKPTKANVKQAARRYLKVIEWSEDDGMFVGSAPPIIGQCCHGSTEAEVLAQLTPIVEEWVELMLKDGKPLPPSLSKKKYSGKFLVRVGPDVHKTLALKASARDESLNKFVERTLAEA